LKDTPKPEITIAVCKSERPEKRSPGAVSTAGPHRPWSSIPSTMAITGAPINGNTCPSAVATPAIASATAIPGARRSALIVVNNRRRRRQAGLCAARTIS
jgi:hypothetical protein